MSVDLHDEVVDVSGYSHLQMYEATFKQLMDIFENDGALFAEDHIDSDEYPSHQEWEDAVTMFNWDILRCLASMDLDDSGAQRFLQTAWDECTRFTGKTGAGLHGQCVGYGLMRTVRRGEPPDWNALADEVLDNERRRSERLKYEAAHPEAAEERRLDEIQELYKCDRATAEQELQKIDEMIHEAMKHNRQRKH